MASVLRNFIREVIVENVSSKVENLIADNGGRVMSFKQLPREAQLAVAWYLAVDSPAWEMPEGHIGGEFRSEWAEEERAKGKSVFTRTLPRFHGEEDQSARFVELLPWFVEKYGNEPFGYVVIPMEQLAQTLKNDYWSPKSVAPHGETNLWPVILDREHGYVIEDGWHRLNRYRELGVENVPAVYFP